jgi:hypothetical protein
MLSVRNSFNLKLPLDIETILQLHMGRNIPIAGHRELYCRSVTSRRNFGCFGENRNHACMRHISFQYNLRSRYWFSVGVSQAESDPSLPDTRRLRRDFVRDGEIPKWFVLTPATVYQRQAETKSNQRTASGKHRSGNDRRQRLVSQRATAGGRFFTLWRKQVIVHSHHHRDEHDCVIEKMYLNAKLRQQKL